MTMVVASTKGSGSCFYQGRCCLHNPLLLPLSCICTENLWVWRVHCIMTHIVLNISGEILSDANLTCVLCLIAIKVLVGLE